MADTTELNILVDAYSKAEDIYHTGRYWKSYSDKITADIRNMDMEQLRSGRYPLIATFGFNEVINYYHPNQAAYKKLILK